MSSLHEIRNTYAVSFVRDSIVIKIRRFGIQETTRLHTMAYKFHSKNPYKCEAALLEGRYSILVPCFFPS